MRLPRPALIPLAIQLLVAACSAAQQPAAGRVIPPPGGSSSPEPVLAVNAPAAVPASSRPPGPITRAEIERVLARGLGVVLARLDVTPVLAGGRFVGFRLERALDLDTWHAAGADVHLGDVLVRVNGIRIERPEQALWAFERLRVADAIQLDVLRDGAAISLRAPIVDRSASTAAP